MINYILILMCHQANTLSFKVIPYENAQHCIIASTKADKALVNSCLSHKASCREVSLRAVDLDKELKELLQ